MTGYRTADGKYIFNSTAPAIREDVTVAIVKLKGYDTTRLPDQSIIEAMFTDFEGISESAKSYVALAVENSLVSRFQDDTFRPQAMITHGEATVMFWRAYQYSNDNKEISGGQPRQTQHQQLLPHRTQPHQAHLHQIHQQNSHL
ncbi:S-layer homology domain-containing protein [Paenibacillus sp. SEL1]